MNNSQRRNYNQEFKIETVRLIESEGYSLNEAHLRLGIPKGTLSKWKMLYGHKQSTNNNVISTSNLTVFEQRQLQKELEKVKRERDILKKALAYFAADPLK